jgi:hypothetical protein
MRSLPICILPRAFTPTRSRMVAGMAIAVALLPAACSHDPNAADDFGFGDESGSEGARASGEDGDEPGDGAEETGGADGADGDGAADGGTPADVPHAHATIVLGEVHTAGGLGQSTPIVAASFVPDTSAQPDACALEIGGCEVVTVPDCGGTCLAGELCQMGPTCAPTCVATCDLACGEGEECYFPVPGSPACRTLETFDAGALSFSGTTVPLTLFPPYQFAGDVTGALALPGQEITVHASGATGAGFAAFDRSFVATELLVTSIDEITMEQAYGPGALPVRWQPGSHEVRVTLTVAGVAGGYGVVTCDAPDTGTFDVPRAAIAAAVSADEPSSIHLDVARRAVALHTDAMTTGALLQATVQPVGWVELVSSSSESITIQGCSGLAFCGGACVDTQSDETNCGACNVVCGPTQTCSLGDCVDLGGGGGGGACCVASGSPGCGDAAVQACVCAQDSYCCSTAWDTACVGEVTSLGCGVC